MLFAFYVADSPGVCVSDMPPPWRLFLRGGHRLRCLVSAAPVERSFAKPGAVRVLAELSFSSAVRVAFGGIACMHSHACTSPLEA